MGTFGGALNEPTQGPLETGFNLRIDLGIGENIKEKLFAASYVGFLLQNADERGVKEGGCGDLDAF